MQEKEKDIFFGEKQEVENEKPEEEEKTELSKDEKHEEHEDKDKVKKIEEYKKKLEEIYEKKEVKNKAEKEQKKSEFIMETLKKEMPEAFGELLGDDSEDAWKKREEFAEKYPRHIKFFAASLAGINFEKSEKARRWLEDNKENRKTWWGIAAALRGNDSDWAWEMRKYLRFDDKVDRIRGERWSLVKKSLQLHKSERIYNFRYKTTLGDSWYEPGDLVTSVTGLDSEKAWETRKEFEDIAPAEVLMSLKGVDSEEAHAIRRKYENDKRLRWAYEQSLEGLEEKERA